LRRNRWSLDALALRSRVLRDVRAIDTGIEAFGRRLRLPVMLAPIGSLESLDPEGGAAVVRAAAAFGVAHAQSSVSAPGLEGAARAAPGAVRIFQLYVRGDDEFVDDYVERALAHGYAALCLNVDTAVFSRRERDLSNRFVARSRRVGAEKTYQAALDWRTVARIRQRFAIPLMLKGLMSVEDAHIAIEHGIDWIYVSNHGGRQLDHGPGTMEVLPEIVDAVAGRARILVDGGFYRGTDIVKAMAAGADLVGIGRLQCYGLAAAGEAGVVRVLELLEDEVRCCLGLLGITRMTELDRSILRPAVPVQTPHALSAFPLLD